MFILYIILFIIIWQFFLEGGIDFFRAGDRSSEDVPERNTKC